VFAVSVTESVPIRYVVFAGAPEGGEVAASVTAATSAPVLAFSMINWYPDGVSAGPLVLGETDISTELIVVETVWSPLAGETSAGVKPWHAVVLIDCVP